MRFGTEPAVFFRWWRGRCRANRCSPGCCRRSRRGILAAPCAWRLLTLASAIGRLLRNEVELAVIGGPYRHERCLVEVLGRNELAPIAALGHPLLSVPDLTAARLAEEPLVLREEGSGARSAVLAAFEAAGVPAERVRVVGELGSTEAVLTAVAAGMGIGFVSAYTLIGGRAHHDLGVPRVRDLAPGRDLVLVSDQGHALSAVAMAFREFLLSEEARALMAAMGRVPPELHGT